MRVTRFIPYLSAHALPHLGHAIMPLLGCNVEAAFAVVGGEHEQVFTAGLYQHLRPCRPRECCVNVLCVCVCVCVCACVRERERVRVGEKVYV